MKGSIGFEYPFACCTSFPVEVSMRKLSSTNRGALNDEGDIREATTSRITKPDKLVLGD